MLDVDHVTKCYGPRTAVDDVSLRVPAGQTVALIGPSGCGKSTLLRLMLGLIQPDAGTITFAAAGAPASREQGGTFVDYAAAGDAVMRRRRMSGYVIQDGGLFPHLTARKNVALLPRTLGWDRNKLNARVAELCELTRFPTDGLDRYPTELSGGQRQRVALMRALVTDPPVLLMDEPLGALDPMIRFGLQTELREIFRRLGKTVVLVTHDLAEANYFADQLVLMRAGRIVQTGTLADLTDRSVEPFVTDFVAAQRTLHP